ncbi:MAG TPA: hypothetical protein VND65_04215 [Candidatus Binatia bacterium]|nr:hypothetical protein [Candidatus Binatia bacterium]
MWTIEELCGLLLETASATKRIDKGVILKALGRELMSETVFHNVHVAVFALWIILLLPWVPFAAIAAMAFDAGPTAGAYLYCYVHLDVSGYGFCCVEV